MAKIKRTYELSSVLTREIKIIAAVKGITINELVETVLTKYVEKYVKKGE